MYAKFVKNHLFAQKSFEFQTHDTNFIFELIEEKDFNFNEYKLASMQEYLEDCVGKNKCSFLPLTVDILKVELNLLRFYLVVNKHFYNFAAFSNYGNWLIIEQSMFRNKVSRSSGGFSFLDVNEYMNVGEENVKEVLEVIECDFKFLNYIGQESEVKMNIFIADHNKSFMFAEEQPMSIDEKREAEEDFIKAIDGFDLTECNNENDSIMNTTSLDKIHFFSIMNFKFMAKFQLTNIFKVGNWNEAYYSNLLRKLKKDFVKEMDNKVIK